MNGTGPAPKPLSLLMELRPALSGHAGIPQETRLLFAALSGLPDAEATGLIQSSSRVLLPRLPRDPAALAALPPDQAVNLLSRVIVSAADESPSRIERVLSAWRVFVHPLRMLLSSLAGRRMGLGVFDPGPFRDFVWRSMFARTLPVADFEPVTRLPYRVAHVPWGAMHMAALATRVLGAVYPRLDTRGFDVMLGETPYPGRVAPGTSLVIRYHDAIPLFMPHTISDKVYHQAAHYHALRRNVRDGAWFACVSDATRQDLLRLFPEAEPRAVTIHNMLSPHYFREESDPARVTEIVRLRRTRRLKAGGGGVSLRLAPGSPPRPNYLLMVSTIEPRKNHLALIDAWERLRATTLPDLDLVLVGSLGWGHASITRRLLPALEAGGLHVLEEVPPAELRVLYGHARATVCPSLSEGFDYSGVEAMRCGNVVLASDIPVHREVFGGAARYFHPYDSEDQAAAINALLAEGAGPERDRLREEGARIAERYSEAALLPQWESLLRRVAARAP